MAAALVKTLALKKKKEKKEKVILQKIRISACKRKTPAHGMELGRQMIAQKKPIESKQSIASQRGTVGEMQKKAKQKTTALRW